MAKTILLADDSVTIQKVVELTFMDEDYEVVAVSNGDEALDRLGDLSPDLVVADVHMPGADGYEVCRRAKESRRGLPVLLLVGTFEPFDEAEAEASGADGFLKKPFDSQELLRRVEELMEAAEEEMAEMELPEEELEPGEVEEAEAESLAPEDETAALPEPPAEEMFEGEALPEPPDEAEALPDPFEEAEGEESAFETESELEQEPEEVGASAISPEPGDDGEPRLGETGAEAGGLSAADVDRIARRVVELMGDDVLRELAWEVVPDLAELVIKDRIRELEQQIE